MNFLAIGPALAVLLAITPTTLCAQSATFASVITGVQDNNNRLYPNRYAQGGSEQYVFNTRAEGSATVDEPETGFYGTGRAYADLTTGKMGVFSASVIRANELNDRVTAQATAGFYDTLKFSVAGASEYTNTPIKIIYSVHGNLSGPGRSIMESTFSVAQNGGQPIMIGDYSADAMVGSPLERNVRPSSKYSFGWSSFEESYSADRYTTALTYDLFGVDPILSVASYLSVATYGNAEANFGNTSSLHFILPENVSFTSESGVFLNDAGALPTEVAAVPEPATWAMMIVGFGLVGAAIRARRQPQLRVTYA